MDSHMQDSCVGLSLQLTIGYSPSPKLTDISSATTVTDLQKSVLQRSQELEKEWQA